MLLRYIIRRSEYQGNVWSFISDLQKEFYGTILSERKERILDYSLDKLMTRERKQNKTREKTQVRYRIHSGN
jgi:hypothetical protein